MGGKASDVNAGGASVRIGTDEAGYLAGLTRCEKRLKAFGASAVAIGTKLAGLGIGLGTGLIAAAKSFADAGSMLDDMSQRTGDTVENLSAIGYAARQSGAGLEELEAGFGKMSGTIAGAIAGEKSSVALLKQLGLDANDLKGKLPTEQFRLLADEIGAISDNDTKIDLVKSIFGKSGTGLIPLLNEGSEGIDKLMQEAQRLGLVMGGEDAAAAAAMGDALDKLWDTMGGLVNTIGGALAPALTDVLTMITDNVAAAAKWISENKGLVIGLGLVAAAVTALGIALAGVGVVATVTGAILGGIGAAIAALTSSFGLLVAGAAAGVIAFVKFTDAGKSMAASVASSLGWLKDVASETFKGISDALAAGDIKSATEILWAGLKVVWQGGMDWIKGIWDKGMIYLRGGMDELQTAIAATWLKFGEAVKKALDDATDLAKKAAVEVQLAPEFMRASVTHLPGSDAQNAEFQALNDKRDMAFQIIANDREMMQRGVNADGTLKDIDPNAFTPMGELMAEFADRAKKRQGELDAVGGPSAKLLELQAELAAMVAKVATEGKPGAELNKRAEQGKAGFEIASRKASAMALGGFAEAGSQGAASSINRSIGLARNPNAGVEAKLDKLIMLQKDTLKATGFHVEEVRFA